MPSWLEVRLAWRNVWRNPRRSGLTVAATVFAVFLVVLMVAFAQGTHSKMIEDGVRLYFGHLSLSGRGYVEQQTLEHFVPAQTGLEEILDAEEGVEGWAGRVSSFGLLSLGDRSRGVAVLGVDPAREGSVSTLPRRVSAGRFLEGGGQREIVLGASLASHLGAELGDELLLYGVAYSLETAYELFTLVGTVRLPAPDLERALALISLLDAQDFFVYGSRLSEIAILATDAEAAEELGARLALDLEARPEAGVELHGWAERMPDLEQFIVLDDLGMYLQLVILVVVVGFGILNTILMSVLERTRELGVMRALGLSPGSVFRLVYLESIAVSLVGLVLGLAIAAPAAVYLQANPIQLTGELAGMMALFGMEPTITFESTLAQAFYTSVAILGVAVLAAAYPALKASSSRPVDALRSL